MGALMTVIGVIARVLLKMLPVNLQGVLGLIFWPIMKGLFGDGVVLANNKDPEYVKKELLKKYDYLNIEIKTPEPAPEVKA
jgi:hypothetical protein